MRRIWRPAMCAGVVMAVALTAGCGPGGDDADGLADLVDRIADAAAADEDADSASDGASDGTSDNDSGGGPGAPADGDLGDVHAYYLDALATAGWEQTDGLSVVSSDTAMTPFTGYDAEGSVTVQQDNSDAPVTITIIMHIQR